ncbi:MAG: sulfotransferase, partial [Actinomycetes bacterium]
MPPPLFIVGTARSGTSWAFDLIAAHPELTMGFESKLPLEGRELYRRFGSLRSQSDLRRLLTKIQEQITDPTSTEFYRLIDEPKVLEASWAAYQASPGWGAICESIFCSIGLTTHWGNKLLRIETTPDLLKLWPDARFVVLTRDPRAVVASQEVKFDTSIAYSAAYWLTHADWVLNRIGEDSRYLVVDLTEMATDPGPTLEWAFSQTGLDCEPIKKLIADHPGDPKRLEKWRGSLSADRQREVEEYCFAPMTRLGYQPELATKHREIGKLRRLWLVASF